MEIYIGFATVVTGYVTAISAEGLVRIVQLGDKVFESDIISTGLGSAVEIEFLNNDVMDLGAHSQTFLDHTVFEPLAKVIEDYVEGDIVDFSDLLQGSHYDSIAGLEHDLHFEKSGEDTVISVDNLDRGLEYATQKIVLQNVDLTASGSLSDQQILSSLLNNHHLIVD